MCLALLLVGLAVGFRCVCAPRGGHASAGLGSPSLVVVLARPARRGRRRSRRATGARGHARATGVDQLTERAGHHARRRRSAWLQSPPRARGTGARRGAIFDDHRLAGTGAGTFGLARLRHRAGPAPSPATPTAGAADDGRPRHGGARADPPARAGMGPGGRARDGPARPHPGPPGAVERRSAWPSSASRSSALVFGAQAALDWTWFVPGPTVMALVAAGWVAGLRPRLPGGEPAEGVAPAQGGSPEAAGPPGDRSHGPQAPHRPRAPGPPARSTPRTPRRSPASAASSRPRAACPRPPPPAIACGTPCAATAGGSRWPR